MLWSMSATAPLVIAALNDVSEPTKLPAPIRAVGCWLSIVEPGARKLTTERPEATKSGLNQPSGEVGPTLLIVVVVSSAVPAVPLSSKAPTVTTRGSSPGDVIVPLNGPALPPGHDHDPGFHAASAAWSNGFNSVDEIGGVPKDKLSTWMPSRVRLATVHPMPAMTVPMSVIPLAPATLTETRPAPGASPRYWPAEAAPLPAIRPATNVPWP